MRLCGALQLAPSTLVFFILFIYFIIFRGGVFFARMKCMIDFRRLEEHDDEAAVIRDSGVLENQ